MENTFTYTARSALAPEEVVTFTLYDDRMSVDLGAPIEHVERALQDMQEKPEAEEEEEEAKASFYAIKPTAISLLERGTHPFRIGDVSAQARNGGLAVTAWVRAKGLRLAPVHFGWEQVDNPEGAHTFVEQLRARKEAASSPGWLRGPMDYWASWLLLAGVLATALFWPRRRDEEQDEQEQEQT